MKKALILIILTSIFASSFATAASLYGNRIKRWTEKAEKGNANYQYKLGNAYLRGGAVSKDPAKAAEWFSKSAKQGYVKAQYKLGFLYYRGQGVKRDYNKAFEWLSKAANKGYSPAQFYLGRLYADGRGTDQDFDQAISWLNKAAKDGYNPAKAELNRVKALKAKTGTPAAPATRIARKQPEKPAPAPAPRTGNKTSKSDILFNGNWRLNRQPAEMLPSGINSCKSAGGSSMFCVTADLQKFTNAAEVTYKVESTISGIASNGSFKVTYRINNIFVLPDDADDPNPTAKIPATGRSKPVTLRCKVINKSKVVCETADKKRLSFQNLQR